MLFRSIHKSRAWIYTNTSQIWFSALNDEADWTSADNAGSITINKGDGNIINGFFSGGDFAIISKVSPSSDGKEGALYALFGSSPFDFEVRKIADVAATGQEGMTSYDNFVAVCTERGIFGIQGRNVFKINDNVSPDYEDTAGEKVTTAIGRHKTTLKVFFPTTGIANNRELIYDVERGVWGFNTGKTTRVIANHPDGRFLMGTSGSSILVWVDDTGTNDDGSAINFYWQTLDMDWGSPGTVKRISSTHLHAKNTGSYNITVDSYNDGTAASEAQTMAVDSEGPVKKFKHRDKRGHFHAVRLTNNTADQPITIYGATMYCEMYEPGGGK